MADTKQAVLRSYLKSALLLTLLLLGFVISSIALDRLIVDAATLVFAISTELLLAIALAFVGTAAWIVVARARRADSDTADMFERLNRRGSEDHVASAEDAKSSRFRRWVSKRLLRHDFIVGDHVLVRPWHEIRATLDDRGCLAGLPFMPEMRRTCGSRAVVFRCVDRVLDYRRTNLMRRLDFGVLLANQSCDGAAHGGCQAACRPIWHTAWLTKDDGIKRDQAYATVDDSVIAVGSRPPNYVCQLTQMQAASKPQSDSAALITLRAWAAGNVTAEASLVALMTRVFNAVQRMRHGTIFPEAVAATDRPNESELFRFKAGDVVIVKTGAEIKATLDRHSKHKGLWFDSDMLKHCGRRYRVQAEIGQLIDAVSGKMLIMKTPSYILKGVDYSGESLLFNPQHDPLMWRAVWLAPVPQSRA